MIITIFVVSGNFISVGKFSGISWKVFWISIFTHRLDIRLIAPRTHGVDNGAPPLSSSTGIAKTTLTTLQRLPPGFLPLPAGLPDHWRSPRGESTRSFRACGRIQSQFEPRGDCAREPVILDQVNGHLAGLCRDLLPCDQEHAGKTPYPRFAPFVSSRRGYMTALSRWLKENSLWSSSSSICPSFYLILKIIVIQS